MGEGLAHSLLLNKSRQPRTAHPVLCDVIKNLSTLLFFLANYFINGVIYLKKILYPWE